MKEQLDPPPVQLDPAGEDPDQPDSGLTKAVGMRPWLQGDGLALLYLLPPIAQFLSPARRDLYHQLLPVTTLLRGVLIDLLLLGILFGIGFAWLNLVAPRIRQWLWLPVVIFIAWVVDRDIDSFISDAATRGRLLPWVPYVPAVVLGVAVLLILFTPHLYRIAIRGLAVILAGGGIAMLLVVLPRLVINSFQRTPREQASFSHPVSHPWQPGELRVVWVLFDELSYNQVFDHRQPYVQLPAFSELARQSILFSHLAPVGYQTDHVIPALFMGQPVADVMGDAKGRMLWRSQPRAPWQSFDPETTVFAAARRASWGTGVAGWYNPYCRILATTLDHCYWAFSEPVAGELFSQLSSRHSTFENVRDGLPLAARIERMWRHAHANLNHTDDYRNLLHQGEALIQDQDIRLAFIHLPIPHPPGIFARRDSSGKEVYDYLGNLMLADQALAELRASVAATPAASDTVLIVSSDHSWRIPIWRGVPGWTRDEEQASQSGIFDQRPVLMVHFPDTNGAASKSHTPSPEIQSAGGELIDKPQSSMVLHSLLLDLISGKVRTAQDMMATIASAPQTEGRRETMNLLQKK